jgi:hypothetical protein
MAEPKTASNKGEVYAHLHKTIDYLAFTDQDVFKFDPDLAKVGWVLADGSTKIQVDLPALFTLSNLDQNDLRLCVINMTAALVRGDRVRATAVMLYMLGKNSIEAKGRNDIKETSALGTKKITENVMMQRFRKIRYSVGRKVGGKGEVEETDEVGDSDDE